MTLPKRPRKLESTTYREPLSCDKGTLYLTVTKDNNGEVQELFISGLGKTGDCISVWGSSLGKILSLYLRSGGNVEDAIDSLEGMRCPEGKDSCPHLIARVLRAEAKDD